MSRDRRDQLIARWRDARNDDVDRRTRLDRCRVCTEAIDDARQIAPDGPHLEPPRAEGRPALAQAFSPEAMALLTVIGMLISTPTFWLFTKFLAVNLPGLTGTGWLRAR